MTERIDPATLTDPRDLAAYWYERMHSDDLSEQERIAFKVWQQADPDNVTHYQQLVQLWQVAQTLPAKPHRHAADTLIATGAMRAQSRRGFVRYGAAITGAVLLILAVVDHGGWFDAPVYESSLFTARGERRQVVLPDDSVILLNTDTVATVRYFKDRRTVQLSRGEVLFQVDGHQGTPFTVDVESGTVRVTGTQFNVRREAQHFSVGVLEGQVEVKAGPWWHRREALLRPGNAVQAHVDGKFDVQLTADVNNTVAWRDGKVVFRGTPLTDVVSELNRYSARPLLVRDAKVGKLRISGVFSADDLSGFLSQLPKIVPVVVREQSAGGAIEIVSL